MSRFTLANLAQATHGQLVGEDRPFDSVAIDSRTLQAGALFVALQGEHSDGHAFVEAAAQRGVAGALVEHAQPIGLPQVVVPNVLEALSVFARQWRRRFTIPVVGVTGSNGKTTTKEMIGAMLARRGPCLVTQGNLNNHIGVPLTLLRLEATHRSAVIEMGANHRGEIAQLAAIAEPTAGIVTNAGAAHLEGFGGLAGVAHGKGELFSALPAEGVAVINADDEFAALWRTITMAKRVVTFGLNAPADFTARDIRRTAGAPITGPGPGAEPAGLAPQFATAFELVTPIGSRRVSLRLGGEHNVRNALGAAAAAHAGGATFEDIVAGLESTRPVSGRLNLKRALHGATLIDDSYNANPSSLKAGLDAFRAVSGTRWLILGDMKELGLTAEELHKEIGAYARAAGISRLLAVGELTPQAVTAFGEGGQWFGDIGALIEEAQRSLHAGVAVLIKGSRSNRLERVSAALAVEDHESDSHGPVSRGQH